MFFVDVCQCCVADIVCQPGVGAARGFQRVLGAVSEAERERAACALSLLCRGERETEKERARLDFDRCVKVFSYVYAVPHCIHSPLFTRASLLRVGHRCCALTIDANEPSLASFWADSAQAQHFHPLCEAGAPFSILGRAHL